MSSSLDELTGVCQGFSANGIQTAVNVMLCRNVIILGKITLLHLTTPHFALSLSLFFFKKREIFSLDYSLLFCLAATRISKNGVERETQTFWGGICILRKCGFVYAVVYKFNPVSAVTQGSPTSGISSCVMRPPASFVN